MKKISLAFAAAMTIAVAACGGDSGNVMASDPNALSPEQVDAALGPELTNADNLVESGNEALAVEPVETTAAAETRETDSAPEPEPEAEPQHEPEPEPEPAPAPEEAPANEVAGNNTSAQ